MCVQQIQAFKSKRVNGRMAAAAQAWLDDNYLGAFASREDCARMLVEDYGLQGDLAALTADLFKTDLVAEYEGGVFHVFTRN